MGFLGVHFPRISQKMGAERDIAIVLENMLAKHPGSSRIKEGTSRAFDSQRIIGDQGVEVVLETPGVLQIPPGECFGVCKYLFGTGFSHVGNCGSGRLRGDRGLACRAYVISDTPSEVLSATDLGGFHWCCRLLLLFVAPLQSDGKICGNRVYGAGRWRKRRCFGGPS